jgi:hypothetical protein
MVGDGLLEVAFAPMRVGAHEVDERQLEARLAGILHELMAWPKSAMALSG